MVAPLIAFKPGSPSTPVLVPFNGLGNLGPIHLHGFLSSFQKIFSGFQIRSLRTSGIKGCHRYHRKNLRHEQTDGDGARLQRNPKP